MTQSKTQKIGYEAEQKACEYLCNKGFVLIQQNYRCYVGEIDLIMQDKEQIVFVEVRYRQDNVSFGSAAESVDAHKMTKLIRAATCFLQFKRWLYKKVSRFDIIAIHGTGNTMKIEWFKNAFTVDG